MWHEFDTSGERIYNCFSIIFVFQYERARKLKFKLLKMFIDEMSSFVTNSYDH